MKPLNCISFPVCTVYTQAGRVTVSLAGLRGSSLLSLQAAPAPHTMAQPSLTVMINNWRTLYRILSTLPQLPAILHQTSTIQNPESRIRIDFNIGIISLPMEFSLLTPDYCGDWWAGQSQESSIASSVTLVLQTLASPRTPDTVGWCSLFSEAGEIVVQVIEKYTSL